MPSFAYTSADQEPQLWPGIRKSGFLFSWLSSSIFILGFSVISFAQSFLLPYFFAVGYATILYALVRTNKIWRDPFNPLCLVLAIAFIRFSCPGFVWWSGAEPPEEIKAMFDLMRLSDSDWQWGHALALVGILAFVLGWVLTQSRGLNTRPLKFYLAGSVKYAAVAGMLVGFIGLTLFFLSNASIGAILTGAFRGTTIQVGTGKYFRLSFLLIAGSVILSCYLLPRTTKPVAFIPVMISLVLYWGLGGRGRAISSLAAGLLLLWYLNRERTDWKKLRFRPRYVLLGAIGIFLVVWLSYVGSIYRGELGGIRAFGEALSLSGLWGYLQASIFTDLGQLHSLAGAIAIGPGVLDGQTFLGSLTWPLDKFLPIPGRSAGVYIIETLVGFSGDEQKWGVNASLIGDAYLNFGLTGVAIVMSLFGVLLKVLYVQFRQGRLHAAIYVIALISAVQAFVVSIEVWPQAMITLVFASGVIGLGNTVFRLR